MEVSNGAKIRNRYNQVPHLTQDTNGKVTNSQRTPQTRAKRSALSIYGLTSQMLHSIKAQGNWPFGSREDFEGVVPYMDMGATMIYVTKSTCVCLFPYPKESSDEI